MLLGRVVPVSLILFCWFGSALPATFVRKIGSEVDERALGVISLSEGGFLVVGTLETVPDTAVACILRVDSLGFPVWLRRVVEPGASTRIHAVCLKGVDTILVAGEQKGARIDCDMYAAELDSSGNIRWQRTWGAVGANDVALGVCPSHDGGWLVVGYTLEFGQHDVRVALIDSMGNVQLGRVLRTPQADLVYAASKAANRGYALVGTKWVSGSRYTDALLLLLNDTCGVARTRFFGDILWDGFVAVTSAADSGLALVGFSTTESTGNDIFLLLTDSTGQGMRQRRYGQRQSDRGLAVAAARDGFVIAGETFRENGDGDAVLLRVDPSGFVCWERTDGGSGFDCLNSVVILPDRGMIAVGQTWDDLTQTSDILLVRTDEWGTVGLADDPPSSEGNRPTVHCLRPSLGGIGAGSVRPARVMSVDGRIVLRLVGEGNWEEFDSVSGTLSSGVYIVQTAEGALFRFVRYRSGR